MYSKGVALWISLDWNNRMLCKLMALNEWEGMSECSLDTVYTV